MSVVLQPGTMLNGRFRVQRVLGTGAFGRVYLAEDVEDAGGLPMAVKELLAMEFATAEEQRDAISWFKREVSTLLTLDHPGIPAIHGYWTAHRTAGPMYLAMDFIPGKTLAEIHAEHGGRVPWRQVVSWAAGLCDVLAYLHGRTPPFVFRDLKPANVLIDERSDSPVLIDFGLARQLIPVGGTAVGTWGYVPFEQVLGKAEPRSDLYALGAMMHALLSGRQPDVEYRRLLRTGLDLEGALRALFPPLDSLVPGLLPALSLTVAKAVAFDADDRFASAQSMATVLRAVLTAPSAFAMPGPVASPSGSLAAAPQPGQEPPSPPVTATDSRPRSGGQAAPTPVTPLQAIVRAAQPTPPSGSVTSDPPPAPSESAPPAEAPRLLPVELESLPALQPLADDSKETAGQALGAGTPATAAPVQKSDPLKRSWWQRMAAMPPVMGQATHVTVSARGGADCTTIAEAIQRCKPGARIEVRPGHYREGVMLDRPVQLVGVGRAEEIVVESATSSTLLMYCEQAEVRNLTLRCSAGMKEERFYAVTIPTGRLVLEDCLIFSDSLACIAIHGENVTPVIRRCVLRNAVEQALSVYDQARGVLEDCDIVGSTIPVRISSQAHPTLRRCQIHHGRFGGVLVTARGRGRFENCEIVDNGHHGVAVRQGSTPILERCRINRNGWSAISITDSSGAIVQHCDLTNNKRSAWDIKESAKLRVDRMGNKEF